MSKRTPVMLVALLVAVLLPAQALAAGGRLLVVLSEANSITLKNGKRHGTGYFLSELMVPAAEVARFGYEIVVATPTGKKPTVDPASDAPGYFKDAAEYKTLSALHAQMVTIRPPLSLRDLDEKQLSSFDGVFFPGGHAPLTDLVSDPGVNRILRYFHERSLPTALICHGPVALLASRKEGSPWLYQGYKMTGFSTAEEKIAQSGALGGEVAFFLDEALSKAGGEVSVGPAWSPFLVRDRELITGQNPMSDRGLSQHLLIALAEGRMRNATRIDNYEAVLDRFAGDRLYQVTPFPKDWRSGVTNLYIGARLPSVSREQFQKVLGNHLVNAKRVFGPAGMRGYLVLSDGDYEIAFMNWASEEALAKAGQAPGRETVLSEAAGILEPLVFEKHLDPTRLAHPALPAHPELP